MAIPLLSRPNLTMIPFLFLLSFSFARHSEAAGDVSSSSFNAALETLQKQIGYSFKSIDLLKQAMTHPSYSQENNRALSILGLSVSESSIALSLLSNNPDASAASVSSAISAAASTSACAAAGARLGIGAIVRVASGTDGSTAAVVCAAFRAVFGAVAVDSGSVDAAGKVFLRIYKSGSFGGISAY
ncbi:hypothetical protein LUZ60_017089 [Juncus effusus]|nr:hypothetical protein LUZ60_017089 [Juncus effusus]